MSEIDAKRIKAVEVLEGLGAYFQDGKWVLPPMSVLPQDQWPAIRRWRERDRRMAVEYHRREAEKAKKGDT